MSAIVVNDLTKRIGKKVIFSNINLEVLEGEFFAVLALDSQGKTTLARILFNFLKPDRGSAYIYDIDCGKDSKTIKESVSYVPEDFFFQENIRAGSLLKKTLAFHNLTNTDELKYLVDYFDFNPKLKVNEMDENEKKIFTIINALIVKPRLIIMDEPTKYLSSEQKTKLYDHLNLLKESENLSALILTNSLVEAQTNCDRAAYLHDGKIKGTEYLKDKIANDKIVKIYSDINDLSEFISIGSKVVKNEENEKILYFDGDLKELSKVIYNSYIDNYNIENSSLEDKISAYFLNQDMNYAVKDEEVTVVEEDEEEEEEE